LYPLLLIVAVPLIAPDFVGCSENTHQGLATVRLSPVAQVSLVERVSNGSGSGL
jgi:hypothetical protein